MGTRYVISVICPHCGDISDDVYYAPTCGFASHVCPECDAEICLEEYTGISAEDASNRQMIESLIGQYADNL